MVWVSSIRYDFTTEICKQTEKSQAPLKNVSFILFSKVCDDFIKYTFNFYYLHCNPKT